MSSQNMEEVPNGIFECFLVVGIEDKPDGSLQTVEKLRYPKGKLGLQQMKGGLETVHPFCFPKLRYERRRCHLSPYSYVFALTLEDGQYYYGYCRKMLPPGKPIRYDVDRRYPEVLCLISKSTELDMFERILDCFQGRRVVDPNSCMGFLQALGQVSPLPNPGASFRFRSSSLGVLCEYKFSRPQLGEKGHADLVFKYLTPKMLRYVVGAVLSEQRIIFISKSESILSNVIHGVLSLIYPFVWQHMLVPLMPEHLLEYLAAPSPYLVGLLRVYDGERLNSLHLGVVIIADLDKNELRTSETVLPFGGVTTDSRMKYAGLSRGEEGLSSAFSMDLVNLYNKSSNHRVDEKELKTLFLSVFVLLFGFVSRFVDHSKGTINKESFVANVADPQMKEFARTFVHTQMFENFVERQLDFKSNHRSKGNSRTGNSRQNAEVIRKQRLEDVVFDLSVAKLRGDSTISDVKRVVRSNLKPRLGSPRTQTIQEAISVIPTTIRTDVSYNPNMDKHFERLARHSYDVQAAISYNTAIWNILAGASERNWRQAYNALLLLQYLLSAGSELIIAAAMKHVALLARTTRLRVNNDMFSKVAQSTYRMLIDRQRLVWERSPDGGHKLFMLAQASNDGSAFGELRHGVSLRNNFATLHQQIMDPQVRLRESIPPEEPTEDLLGLGSISPTRSPLPPVLPPKHHVDFTQPSPPPSFGVIHAPAPPPPPSPPLGHRPPAAPPRNDAPPPPPRNDAPPPPPRRDDLDIEPEGPPPPPPPRAFELEEAATRHNGALKKHPSTSRPPAPVVVVAGVPKHSTQEAHKRPQAPGVAKDRKAVTPPNKTRPPAPTQPPSPPLTEDVHDKKNLGRRRTLSSEKAQRALVDAPSDGSPKGQRRTLNSETAQRTLNVDLPVKANNVSKQGPPKQEGKRVVSGMGAKQGSDAPVPARPSRPVTSTPTKPTRSPEPRGGTQSPPKKDVLNDSTSLKKTTERRKSGNVAALASKFDQNASKKPVANEKRHSKGHVAELANKFEKR